jgi:cell division protein FtsN
MPIETKKVLWTALSVLIVLVVAFGIALAFVVPRGDSAMAPASIGSTTPPRVAAPEAYIRTAEPAPVPQAPGSTAPAADSGVIIVYGEKPATPALPSPEAPVGQTTATAASTSTTAGSSTSAATVTPAKPYTPAPPASSAPKATAQTTAAKPAAVAKPATTATVTEYWIQAASFTSRSRAEDLQRSLVEKGLSSLITIKEIDGTPYFRVRIGPYNAKTEADGWLVKVRQMAGCEEAYVSMQTVQRSN